MLIARKKGKKPEPIRSTLRLKPKEQQKLLNAIHHFQQNDIRTSKNEILRIALNEYLNQNYDDQEKQLKEQRLREKTKLEIRVNV